MSTAWLQNDYMLKSWHSCTFLWFQFFLCCVKWPILPYAYDKLIFAYMHNTAIHCISSLCDSKHLCDQFTWPRFELMPLSNCSARKMRKKGKARNEPGPSSAHPVLNHLNLTQASVGFTFDSGRRKVKDRDDSSFVGSDRKSSVTFFC